MKLNLNYTKDFLKKEELEIMEGQVKTVHSYIHDKTAQGNDFLGWVNLPSKSLGSDEVSKIKKIAKNIQENYEVLLVIGIGGSYLGARSAIELLSPYFNNKGIEVVYCGHQLSGTYLKELYDYLKTKNFAINIISKSGTTTEPAVAFRIFEKLLVEKLGDKACEAIFATTDSKAGALKKLADMKGYETLVIPDDVGGRFSVLTPVGLLPIACSGVDIDEILKGAIFAEQKYSNPNLFENDAYLYAATRNVLNLKGYNVEILVDYEPSLFFFSEWWKQLFGESEGKNLKGIFPASAHFTTDLHSLGQYIQDGKRFIFETVIDVKKPNSDVALFLDDLDLDGLNYLAEKTVNYVSSKAMEGTINAHVSGNVPNLVLELESITPYNYGEMVYFFEMACAMSAYLLGVNPFDQPGVEKYKKNMFELLGK